jgi:hypothetical protein
MTAFKILTTDFAALVRLLERDALEQVATAPALALRPAFLASELRRLAQ